MEKMRNMPYGYKKLNKAIAVEENEKIIIEKIISLALGNLSKGLIIDYLNNNKLLPRLGGTWSLNALNKIVSPQRLEFYSGLNNDIPIISEKTKNDILAKSSLYKKEPSKIAKGNKYLLSGLENTRTVCGYCENNFKTIISEKSKAGGGISRNLYYSCSNPDCRGHKMHKQQNADSAVLEEILHLYRNKTKIQKIIDKEYKLKTEQRKVALSKLHTNFDILFSELANTTTKSDFEIAKNEIVRLFIIEPIIDNSFYKFEFSQNINSVSSLDIIAKRDIVTNYVEQITIWDDVLEILFRFPIDTNFNRKVVFSLLISQEK